VPEEWAFDQARQLFKEPDVLLGDAVDVSILFIHFYLNVLYLILA
jgi:hypothetical protein